MALGARSVPMVLALEAVRQLKSSYAWLILGRNHWNRFVLARRLAPRVPTFLRWSMAGNRDAKSHILWKRSRLPTRSSHSPIP